MRAYLELLHLVLQLRLFLHHMSPLGVQPGLHLSSHLLHLAQHLCPVERDKTRRDAEAENVCEQTA